MASSTVDRWLRPEDYPLFAAVRVAVGICGFQLVRTPCINPEVRFKKFVLEEGKIGMGKVDGMDALSVKQASKFVKQHALVNGPIILEMDTYRYHGHSMSYPGSTYLTQDEITGVKQEHDLIERIRKLILSHELVSTYELKDIEKEVRKEVDDAIAQAKESPIPDPSDLFTNVYVKGYGAEVQAF